MIIFFLLYLSIDSKSEWFPFSGHMLNRKCGPLTPLPLICGLTRPFCCFPFLLLNQHMAGHPHGSQSIKHSLSLTLPFFSPWWYGNKLCSNWTGNLRRRGPHLCGVYSSNVWFPHCGWSKLPVHHASRAVRKPCFSFLLLPRPIWIEQVQGWVLKIEAFFPCDVALWKPPWFTCCSD